MENVIERIGELLSLLQSSDFYEREEAVRELGNYQQDEAIAGLVMALEDPDLGIREISSEYLGSMKGNLAPQLLIKFLANEDIGTRNLASEILVRIGSDSIKPLIAEIDDDDHDVRKFVVDILGLLKDDQAFEAVCSKLNDSNINVVCSAAEALGEIRAEKAIPYLINAFK